MMGHIDLEIIRCLQNNARIQWKQIGEIINVMMKDYKHTKFQEFIQQRDENGSLPFAL